MLSRLLLGLCVAGAVAACTGTDAPPASDTGAAAGKVASGEERASGDGPGSGVADQAASDAALDMSAAQVTVFKSPT